MVLLSFGNPDDEFCFWIVNDASNHLVAVSLASLFNYS